MRNPDAKLISSAKNITYLTKLSFFSETEREVFLIISKNKKFLITDRRYSEEVKKITKQFEIIDCGALNFIAKEAKEFFKNEKIKSLGFEVNNLTVSEFKLLENKVKLVPIDLKSLREIKSNEEIKYIKNACKIGDSAFKFILSKLKVGVTERKIAEELENYFKSKNVSSSFQPIVAFGINSSIPHHQSNNTKLRKNQMVLLDFGVKVNGYCSDMTRTVFFGSADSKFKSMHQTVLDAQQSAIKEIKNDIKASNIDKAARDFIIKNGYPDIIHSVGHGIGLEVHESPSVSPKSEDIIKNNMIFSIEPGIYLKSYGGVRIEDLVLVRSGKAELISKAKRGLIETND